MPRLAPLLSLLTLGCGDLLNRPSTPAPPPSLVGSAPSGLYRIIGPDWTSEIILSPADFSDPQALLSLLPYPPERPEPVVGCSWGLLGREPVTMREEPKGTYILTLSRGADAGSELRLSGLPEGGALPAIHHWWFNAGTLQASDEPARLERQGDAPDCRVWMKQPR